ncbi:MAG: hypothetical protein H6698_07855 [Myxococcales bacterium]|nr:hypothetical protein [Myxococcales bacterium]MCB9521090.1 hypothetical protein [Myxococcales bacterium]MCB9534201.1 hypothetical protein [Myxococcales bacterium]
MSGALRVTLVHTDDRALDRDAGALIASLCEAGADVAVTACGGRVEAVAGVRVDAAPSLPIAAADALALVPLLVARFADASPHIVHALDLRAAAAVAAAARVTPVGHVVASVWSDLAPMRAPLRAPRVERLAETVARHLFGRVDGWVLLGPRREGGLVERICDGPRTVLDAGMGVAVDAPAASDRPAGASVASEVLVVGSTRQTESDAARCADALRAASPLPVVVVDLDTPGAWLESMESARAAVVFTDGPTAAYAAMEAAAAAVPAVVWAATWAAELARPGISGAVIPRGDVARAVAAARAYDADATLRASHSAAARSYAVRVFDRELAAARVLRLYDELLDGTSAEPARVTPDGRVEAMPVGDRRRRDLLRR